MSEEHDWLVGHRVTVSRVDPATPELSGRIVEINEVETPDGETHIRVVVDTGDQVIDTSKDRVDLA